MCLRFEHLVIILVHLFRRSHLLLLFLLHHLLHTLYLILHLFATIHAL
jgi:hypothetical protein